MDFRIPDSDNSRQHLNLLPYELKIHIIQSILSPQCIIEDVYTSLSPLFKTSKEYYNLVPHAIMDYYKKINPSMFNDYCCEIALRIGAIKWLKNYHTNHNIELAEKFHLQWLFNIDCINDQALQSLFKWACINQYSGLVCYLLLKDKLLINAITDRDWLEIIEKQNLKLVNVLIKCGKSNKNLQAIRVVDIDERYKEDCILIHAIYRIKKWCPMIELFCTDDDAMHKAIEFLKKEITLNANNYKNDNYIRILLYLANKIKPSKEHEIEIFLKNLGKRDDYFVPLSFVSRRRSMYN